MLSDMSERAGPTMRLRLHYRIVLVVAQAAMPGFAALLVWTTMGFSSRLARPISVPVLALATAAWLVLATRTWRASVTLTPGTLQVSNVFRTVRCEVSSVTRVWFSQGGLRVSFADAGVRTGRHSGGRQIQVTAARLGAAHWSGRRTPADEFADALTASAGLPPLVPRVQPAAGCHVRVFLAGGAVLAAAGIGVEVLGQLASGAPGTMVRLLGGLILYGAGFVLYPPAMVVVDGFFSRWRDASPASGREATT
jgi:hypothetical protein